jgi:hypothetical protein
MKLLGRIVAILGGIVLTHIAIQEKLDGEVLDWMEQGSDEQYRARK